MKTIGIDVDKKISRWLRKLVGDDIIKIEGEIIIALVEYKY